MPAFIAHLLIAKDVFKKSGLEEKDENQKCFLLGSVAPDLPCYGHVFDDAIKTFWDETFRPQAPGFYTGPGDYFHARTPNLFPMKMLETIRKDKDLRTETLKFAFCLGYLTHVAADQKIHPFVEQYAGSYYLSADNRGRHRTKEVYDDILLYESLTKKSFFSEKFPPWFDVAPQQQAAPTDPKTDMPPNTTQPRKTYTPDWLRSLVQRAYLEAYCILIHGDEIEDWLRGFNTVFKFFEDVGPYHDFAENIRKDLSLAPGFKKMFDQDYISKCFEPAKALARDYITAATLFFQSKQISDKERNAFLSAVSDADLVSPLS